MCSFPLLWIAGFQLSLLRRQDHELQLLVSQPGLRVWFFSAMVSSLHVTAMRKKECFKPPRLLWINSCLDSNLKSIPWAEIWVPYYLLSMSANILPTGIAVQSSHAQCLMGTEAHKALSFGHFLTIHTLYIPVQSFREFLLLLLLFRFSG